MLSPENFKGPRTILIGPATPAAMDFAVGLVMRYSKEFSPDNALIAVEQAGERRLILGASSELAAHARTLADV
jgi:hypothetical protein